MDLLYWFIISIGTDNNKPNMEKNNDFAQII